MGHGGGAIELVVALDKINDDVKFSVFGAPFMKSLSLDLPLPWPAGA